MGETPRTDQLALECLYQASAGVLTEDDSITKLIEHAKQLEGERSELLALARQLAEDAVLVTTGDDSSATFNRITAAVSAIREIKA